MGWTGALGWMVVVVAVVGGVQGGSGSVGGVGGGGGGSPAQQRPTSSALTPLTSSLVPDFSRPRTPQTSLIMVTLTLLLVASLSALVLATDASAQPLKARRPFLRVVCLPGLP